jgi:DNA-binding CsgD family transcriptional regulator
MDAYYFNRHLGAALHLLSVLHAWRQVADQVGCAPRTWRRVGLMLFRGTGPDFSECDRDLLALLRPTCTRPTSTPNATAAPPQLTPRHWELLRLVAAGHTDAQIARRLGVTEKTVGKHLENIYTRLQVSSHTAAVNRASPPTGQHKPQQPPTEVPTDVTDLGDRGHVDRVIEPAVSAPGQPAGLPAAGRHLDRGGAVAGAATWSRCGKRDTWRTSPMTAAETTGPTPNSPITLVPAARTAAAAFFLVSPSSSASRSRST